MASNDVVVDQSLDPLTEAFTDAVSDEPNEAAIEFEGWKQGYYERSWEWHLWTNKIIFWFVLFVVTFSLLIAGAQFVGDLRRGSLPETNSKDKQGEENGDSHQYDIQASFESVSIKSKTIGAVILVFSGVFFFLYLVYVYPMDVIEAEDEKLSDVISEP
ncbi:hypothetical protein [Hyphomonas sp.]|uniref:hypothetical protein n=1 Tax=Hyphomonas sp. TaxID=87 RepID=UPI00329970FE